MDQIELDVLETDEKSNKYYLFVKKVTLQFLLPVSLVSFLLSYTSGFSFFNFYKYHLSTFVFPLLTHVFERKYMFLLCNGILAFLAKSMSFSSSSYDVSDKNGKILDGSDSDGKIKETSEARQEEGKASQHAELETEVEQGEQKAEAENERGDASTTEDNGHEGEEEIERECGGLIGAPRAEDGSTDMNTEELNKKIEAFIRKMKEEIRIEAQHQLISV